MSKFIEIFLPPVISITCAHFLSKFNIVTYANSEELIKQFPIIGTCAFGFLLTMFSLIIQGNNDAINRMRKREKPFSRFVCFNKKVVIISFVTTFYSYFVGYFKFDKDLKLVEGLVVIFYLLLIYFIIEVFYFLLVFYILVQGEKKEIK